LLFCLLLVSCEGKKEKPSVEMTKNMLKIRGYNFTEEDFFRAIQQNDTIAINGFFEAGFNPNQTNKLGETALTYAISNAESKTIKLIADHSDINLRDNLGQSPIHLALLKQKEEIFDYLLEKGADVNIGGAKGNLKNQTVLYLAVTRNREDLVQKLLEKGADPNIADSDGSLPLAEACIGASVNPNIVQMLIDKGANVNLAEVNGMTPLMYIAENTKAPLAVRQSVVEILLKAGADKKIKDKKGKTALDWALERKNIEIAKELNDASRNR
jgi:ankyrin repeat protein